LLASGASGARISRCTFTRSYGPSGYSFSSLSFSGGSPQVSSVIVAEYYVQFGLLFGSGQNVSFRYSNIWVTGGNFIGFINGDSAQGPVGIGVRDTINAIGDICDSYLNIYFDPEFVDVNGDYTLTAWSPCINTGDPNIGFDPDGTTADMGAFYHSQVSAQEPREVAGDFALAQNYPNPFNSSTRIAFSLPRAGDVELTLFDVTGKRVATLLSESLGAGKHELNFDAGEIPSGVYFYHLTSGGFSETRKMMLLK
jgi:hypothetical protein